MDLGGLGVFSNEDDGQADASEAPLPEPDNAADHEPLENMPLYDENMCGTCFYDVNNFTFCCETGKAHKPRRCPHCSVDLAGAARVPKMCVKGRVAHDDPRQKTMDTEATDGVCNYCGYPTDGHMYCTVTGWKHATLVQERQRYLGGGAAPKPVPKAAPKAQPPAPKVAAGTWQPGQAKRDREGSAPAAQAAAAPAPAPAPAPAAAAPALPARGALVETHSLSKDELNGLQGYVLRHQNDRLVIELPQPHGEKALRAVNVRVIVPAPTEDDAAPPAKRTRVEEPAAPAGDPNAAWIGQPDLEFWSGVQTTSKVLIVGDGNFSFSYCLARRLGNAEGMVCTDAVMNSSVKETCHHYLLPLCDLGATVSTRVDATRLGKHCLIRRCGQYFDYVVWNFPHTSTPNKAQHSQEEHRQLLRRYLQQAELVLAKGGRACITVKDGYPYDAWQVHTLGTGKLHYLGCEAFTAAKFPVYAHVTTRTSAQINRVFPAHTYVFGALDE